MVYCHGAYAQLQLCKCCQGFAVVPAAVVVFAAEAVCVQSTAPQQGPCQKCNQELDEEDRPVGVSRLYKQHVCMITQPGTDLQHGLNSNLFQPPWNPNYLILSACYRKSHHHLDCSHCGPPIAHVNRTVTCNRTASNNIVTAAQPQQHAGSSSGLPMHTEPPTMPDSLKFLCCCMQAAMFTNPAGSACSCGP